MFHVNLSLVKGQASVQTPDRSSRLRHIASGHVLVPSLSTVSRAAFLLIIDQRHSSKTFFHQHHSNKTFHQDHSNRTFFHQDHFNKTFFHQDHSNKTFHQDHSNRTFFHQDHSNEAFFHRDHSNKTFFHQDHCNRTFFHQDHSNKTFFIQSVYWLVEKAEFNIFAKRPHKTKPFFFVRLIEVMISKPMVWYTI